MNWNAQFCFCEKRVLDCTQTLLQRAFPWRLELECCYMSLLTFSYTENFMHHVKWKIYRYHMASPPSSSTKVGVFWGSECEEWGTISKLLIYISRDQYFMLWSGIPGLGQWVYCQAWMAWVHVHYHVRPGRMASTCIPWFKCSMKDLQVLNIIATFGILDNSVSPVYIYGFYVEQSAS